MRCTEARRAIWETGTGFADSGESAALAAHAAGCRACAVEMAEMAALSHLLSEIQDAPTSVSTSGRPCPLLPVQVQRKISERPRGQVFSCQLGWLGVGYWPRGLLATTAPVANREDAVAALRRQVGDALAVEPTGAGGLGDTVRLKIMAFLDGEPVSFDEPVDLSALPEFRQVVLQAARSIPYGQVRTYGWLARQIGRPQAARAVGGALAANPLAIVIPCHRVLGASGSLVGFRWGIETKRLLLQRERATLI